MPIPIRKFSKVLLFSLLVFFVFPLSSFAQTEEETLTITTYYPAPYGVYNEMRAKKMAVGTNYYDGSAYPWDTGGGCTGNEICNADLVVQGNVGIGTANPQDKLDVYGDGDNILSVVNSASKLGVWIGHNGNRGIVRTTYWPGGSDIFSPLTFQTNNVDRIYITTAGNVGIGTTTPGSKLAVAGEITAGSGADKTVFHKGNLIRITCGYSWIPHPGGWAERIWTSGDCGSPPKLPSQYTNCMRAISGSDWSIPDERLIYCNTDTLRVFQPSSANAYARCDYLCWD